MSKLVKCEFCDEFVTQRGMATHLRTNKRCISARRVNALCSQQFVLCHKQAPIYVWLTTYLNEESTSIWEHDDDGEPWVPSWFAEVWFRAEKSIATGRLVCDTLSFLETVRGLIDNERRKGALATQARLRDVGFFNHTGSIYRSDCKTPIWETRRVGNYGGSSQSEYNDVASTMMRSSDPFIGTRYRR